MAPKPAAPAKKNVPESGVSIQGYCDAIKGVAVLVSCRGSMPPLRYPCISLL